MPPRPCRRPGCDGSASRRPSAGACRRFAILLGRSAPGRSQRQAWKEGLIAQIEARATATPGALPPEAEWPAGSPQDDEYRHVRVTGRFLHDKRRPCTASCRAGPAPASRCRASRSSRRCGCRRRDRDRQPRLRADRAARPGDAGPRARSGRRGHRHRADARARSRAACSCPPNDPAKNDWFTRDPARSRAPRASPASRPSTSTPTPTPEAGRLAEGRQTRLATSRTTTCNTR